MTDQPRSTDEEWRELLTAQARENSGLLFKLAYGVLRNRVAAEDACRQALLAWLHQFRRLRIRYERRDDIHEVFMSISCSLICMNYLNL